MVTFQIMITDAHWNGVRSPVSSGLNHSCLSTSHVNFAKAIEFGSVFVRASMYTFNFGSVPEPLIVNLTLLVGCSTNSISQVIICEDGSDASSGM